MKLNIIKEEEGYVEVEFGGESHTLLNLLQTSLLEDPAVEMAGYTRPHPLMDRSRLFIRFKGKKANVKEILKKAADNAEAKLKEFDEGLNQSISNLKK
ncbi:MAG: RpoL/Rpb11 RNA polymerase subunit family protein [Candidatus Bathyarchaeia archaeon]|jgi:DNA-directed RNA polymerase subunit L